MWAARVHALGGEPALEEDVPEPRAAAGETLVAVEAAAVGHLDLTIAAGTFPVHPPLPYVPGTDAAGRVLESPTLAVGARVFVRGDGVGFERSGCWAERAAVPTAAVHPLPDEIDPVTGATFFVPCSTAHVALTVVGGLEPGDRVAVRGAAGAVGSAAVQLARAGGARDVLEVVRTIGDAPAGDSALADGEPATIAALAADGGIDLLVDTVGGVRLGALVDVMRPGGRIVLVGLPRRARRRVRPDATDRARRAPPPREPDRPPAGDVRRGARPARADRARRAVRAHEGVPVRPARRRLRGRALGRRRASGGDDACGLGQRGRRAYAPSRSRSQVRSVTPSSRRTNFRTLPFSVSGSSSTTSR